MKELIYRNILQDNPRKHLVSIEETNAIDETARDVQVDNRVYKKWMCKYYIKDKYFSRKLENLREWINIKNRRGCEKNCHILREVNTSTGESKIICKMLGEFFVIRGRTAYDIIYINEVRIHISEKKA